MRKKKRWSKRARGSRRARTYASKDEIHPHHKLQYVMTGIIAVLILLIIVAAVELAIKTKEERLKCEAVESVEERDNCYLQYVMKTGDTQACRLITISYLQDSCLELR